MPKKWCLYCRQNNGILNAKIWVESLMKWTPGPGLFSSGEEIYLVSIRIWIEWIFSCQHCRGDHDADQNNVAKVRVVANEMAHDTKSGKIHENIISNLLTYLFSCQCYNNNVARVRIWLAINFVNLQNCETR